MTDRSFFRLLNGRGLICLICRLSAGNSLCDRQCCAENILDRRRVGKLRFLDPAPLFLGHAFLVLCLPLRFLFFSGALCGFLSLLLLGSLFLKQSGFNLGPDLFAFRVLRFLLSALLCRGKV